MGGNASTWTQVYTMDMMPKKIILSFSLKIKIVKTNQTTAQSEETKLLTNLYNQNHGVLIQETHALKKAVKIATSYLRFLKRSLEWHYFDAVMQSAWKSSTVINILCKQYYTKKQSQKCQDLLFYSWNWMKNVWVVIWDWVYEYFLAFGNISISIFEHSWYPKPCHGHGTSFPETD